MHRSTILMENCDVSIEMMKLKLAVMILALALIACNEEPFGQNRKYSVPEKLQPFVTDFVRLANQRGVTVDTTNLIVVYAVLHDRLGEASLNEKIIRVDSSNAFFRNGNIETIMFHELGHLFLNRQHDDTYFNNSRTPKSIMHCCDLPMYNGWSTRCRQYYIEELFNPECETPNF